MTDLTTITTPFGLLDAETQAAIKAHGGPYQYWFPEDGWRDYKGIGHPTWTVHTVYRVKPAPPKPREWWIEISPSGMTSMAHPEPPEKMDGRNTLVHVREVLP